MRYLIERPERVLMLTLEHLRICVIAVLIAIVIGVPLGIFLTRQRWLEAPIVGAVSVLYTVPSLALFAVLIPFTGLGPTPAIVALVLYSLLAIVRNTVAGIDSVDPMTLDAARGMGMTARQRLLLVQLPLGLPVILAGVRVAAVAAISITTIGAAIGAGGLGLLIFEGIRTLNSDRIVAGTLAIAALALIADRGLAWWGRRLRRDTAGERGGRDAR
ncbi:MAG TPA: ABC transporter permease [Thermomicrobiales bacterium]|jgi:osmoprotectant transport system permease protein